jgi:heavy metal sensor kinase
MIVVGWIGSRWLAREALAPVEALTATAEQISVPSLRTRMTLAAPYEEFDRLARVFNAMLDRLHHVFEGQRQFIADAAHEIQTPLTVIKGTLEVALQKSRTTEDYRDALVTNLGQVERLGTLTRSLLTLAQFSGDRPPVTLSPLALEPLVQDLIKELSPLAEDRKIQLILDAQPVPRVQGDAGRLTQLLINLLDNALAYTPPEGRITIRLKPIPAHVVLQVEDTGAGIAPEHLPRLFERFYRADPARTRESGGTGLGLAIVKEIAEAHGGTVAVESTPGQGTRFTVTLPACAAGDVSAG